MFSSAKELADSLVPFCEGHVLSDLAECGRDLALREDEQVPQPPTLPPFVQKAEIPTSAANVTRADGLGGRLPGIGRRIATWMLVPLVLLAGIVIWIQTDNGTLVVESPSGDIPIEIRTGGKFHRNETLSVGKNELTIRSGTYEIVLPKEYDSLKVENQVFTLERGGEWIARVSKKKAAQAGGQPAGITPSGLPGVASASPGGIPGRSIAASGMPPGVGIPGATGLPSEQSSSSPPGTPRTTNNDRTLVFSGKTFEEWQQAVLTERNPVELKNAVEALCVLGKNNQDAEAAETVLAVVDGIDLFHFEQHAITDEALLLAAAIRHLRMLDAESIIPIVTTAVREGRTSTRTLILNFLVAAKEYPHFAIGNPRHIGRAMPLAENLNRSIMFRDAVMDIFSELDSNKRLTAFGVILSHLNSENPGPHLIEFLKRVSRSKTLDRVSVIAARTLAEVQPSPELADIFLTRLENTSAALAQMRLKNGDPQRPLRLEWFNQESNAWVGLAALGRHASGSVDRIIKLMDGESSPLTEGQAVYLMEQNLRSNEKFNVSRELLAIEILALIGPEAKAAVPAINKVLHELTGHQPTTEAAYGFEAGRNHMLLEKLSNGELLGETSSVKVRTPKSIRNIPGRAETLNSAILAIQRITGEFPQFDVARITAISPRAGTGLMGSGYPGGSSEGMMEGDGGGEDYGQDASEQHSPRLVTYKGKAFAEWANLRNISLEIPLSDLRDMFRGASLLAATPEERKSAAAIANGAFGYAIRQPWQLTPELQTFLVATIEASYSHDPIGILTPIEDALAQVTPARQAFLLSELLLPVEESEFGYRLHERPFSRKGVANPQFPNAYNDLVENWDKHPTELQEAILQVEAHLPTLGQKNSVKLLTRLVEESLDSIGDGAIPVATPSDLQLKAAFILAATSPKDPTIQGQLEKLLAGVLARPHVLRRNSSVENRNAAAEAKAEEDRKPTMRDLDADRLHAAVALKLACGGELSEATARQFASLIVRDTERHEVGSFRIVSPPNGPTIGVGESEYGGMDEYSDAEMAAYPSGGGYPVAGGGSPGMGAGGRSGMPGTAGGMSDYPGGSSGKYDSGGHPGGVMTQLGNQQFSMDHGDFSRRVLLIRLLLTSPPKDPEVKSEIGELLATSLLKRYPRGFLPSPPTENSNVSVYDLIETEFRSGVRYRKRPTVKKASSELSSTEPMSLEVARFLDTASSVVWNYLPDDRRMQIHKTRVAELQAAETAGANPQQLYDGKSFEAWLQVVSTERSPERLVEAVQALTVLGKDGRDAEVARAILTCLAPFKCNSVNKNDLDFELTTAARSGLFELDEKILVRSIADTITQGNSNQRRFLFKLNSTWLRSWLAPDGPLKKPEFVSVFLAATRDDDAEIRQLATTYLAPLLLAEGVRLDDSEQQKVKDRLIELLSDETVRVPAAVCISKLAPLTEGLPEILVDEINRLGSKRLPDTTYRLCDVHWALRTLMKNPKLQNELNGQLAKLLDKLDQSRNQWLYHSIHQNMHFTSISLLIETLLEYPKNSDTEAQSFSISLRKHAGPKDATADIDALAPVEANPTNIIGKSYSPILNDDYVYPLPISSFSHLGHTTVALDVNAAAAKWALEQIEKNSGPESTNK